MVRVRWRDGRDGREGEYKWGQDDSYEVQLKLDLYNEVNAL